jgi:hypothetical protein
MWEGGRGKQAGVKRRQVWPTRGGRQQRRRGSGLFQHSEAACQHFTKFHIQQAQRLAITAFKSGPSSQRESDGAGASTGRRGSWQ